MTIPTKHCRRCGHDLPLGSFWRRSQSRDQLQHWCRDCLGAARSAWQADHPVETHAYSRARRARLKLLHLKDPR